MEMTNQPTDPLAAIAEHLGAIRAVLDAGHAAAEQIRLEARAALEAQKTTREAAATAQGGNTSAPGLDPFPFISVPAGTTVRDLPSGDRLFALADGTFVRANADGEVVVIDDSGEPESVAPARGGVVHLPDGRELEFDPELLQVTHEAAGISGLPASVEPILVAEGHYSLTLPDGTRIEISHPDRLAVVITRIGTLVVLGARLEALGEKLESRPGPGGLRSFSSSESRVQGIVTADGTIHLTTPGGEDLVIRFPDLDTETRPTQPLTLPSFCGGARA
jgi:hypothetical protein